jgi:DNA-directed RNA polymerase beta subunit
MTEEVPFSKLSYLLGNMKPPELEVSDESELTRQLFDEFGSSKSIIAIYNHWVKVVLPKQIENRYIQTQNGIIQFHSAIMEKPMYKNTEKLTPYIAQNQSYTYSGVLKAKVRFLKWVNPADHSKGYVVYEEPENKKGVKASVIRKSEYITLGEIPVMMGSDYCWLGGMSDNEKIRQNECPNDPLGYFIINGTSKVITIQEKLRMNMHLTYMNTNDRIETRNTYPTNVGSTVVSMIVGKKWQTLKVHMYHIKSEHNIPVYILYAILMFDVPTMSQWREVALTDPERYTLLMKELYNNFTNLVLSFCKPEEKRQVYYALQTSLFKALGKIDIVDYIATRKREFNLKDRNMDDVYAQIKADITNDFFGHVEEAQKPTHLAYMASNTLKYLLGFRKIDDRDSWANKRLDSSGANLAQLFNSVWGKAFVESATNSARSNPVDEFNFMQMASRITQKSIITDNFQSSFQAKSWGLKGSKQMENYTDTLKKETPMAIYSQVGRINTPSARMTKKSSAREIKPTEPGYVCPAETPEGEGVGLLKNMALLCTISRERTTEDIDLILSNEANSHIISKTLIESWIPFIVNGSFRAWINPATSETPNFDILKRPIPIFEDYLRTAKRTGAIPFDSCIHYNRIDNILEYYCDGSRPMRPLLLVDTDGQLIIDKKKLWGRPTSELLREGAMEFVDSREQEFIMLAMFTEDVRERYRRTLELTDMMVRFDSIRSISRRSVDDVFQLDVDKTSVREITNKLSGELYQYLKGVSSLAKKPFDVNYFNKVQKLIIDTFYLSLINAITLDVSLTGTYDLVKCVETARISSSKVVIDAIDEAKRTNAIKITTLPQVSIPFDLLSDNYDKYTFEVGEIGKAIENTLQKLKEEFEFLKSALPFTHSEIEPVSLLGIAGSLEPRPNCGQGPRAVYQASMCKQALGFYHYNHHLKFDTGFKIILNPSRPMFETITAEVTGLNSAPTGTTAIMGVLVTKNNNEDAVTAKLEYINCNNFDMVKYSTHKTSITVGEALGKPQARPGEAEGRYAAIGENGLPYIDRFVRPGDCIIGKGKKNLKTGKVNNSSVFAGVGEEGYIDRILVTWNAKSEIVIKVKVRQTRKHVSGDKIASRYAQKGTLSDIISEKDLPRVVGGINDGLVPDLFCNPHSLPSRMTANMLQEMLACKAALYTGERVDATCWHEFNKKEWSDKLVRHGMEQYGNETMMWPNGKVLECPVFVAPCYYQLLRHHVRDKIQYRGRGAIKPLTHQPVGSRALGGGLRVGEMERDGMISHGASALVLERLMIVSDAYTTSFCTTCGDFAVANVETGKFSCQVCGDKAQFVSRRIPYVFKLVKQLLAIINMNITAKFSRVSSKALKKESPYYKYLHLLN